MGCPQTVKTKTAIGHFVIFIDNQASHSRPSLMVIALFYSGQKSS
jgi:hypothetical protein